MCILKPVEPVKIIVKWNNIKRLIGKEIEHKTIKVNPFRYRHYYRRGIRGQVLQLIVPTFKTDVTREADVIEEILRIYGYDSVEMPGQLRSSLSFSNKPDPERIRNLVSDLLSSRGFYEIMNNSLTRSKYAEESSWLDAANSVKLLNPLSNDLNVMRQTLLFGGLETIAYNQNRKTSDLNSFMNLAALTRFTRIKIHPPNHWTGTMSMSAWPSG